MTAMCVGPVSLLDEPSQTAAGYQLGWWNADRVSFEGAAGRSSPVPVVRGSATACGGTAACALPLTVVVDLMRNFSLSYERVRRYAAHKDSAVWGKAVIDTGDDMGCRETETLGLW
jgi:hypothetical protein